MSEIDNLIGSKIALINHQDIRYDGTLFAINTETSSLVLKDVRMHGTEDRVTDPAAKVAAASGVTQFVTFPGAEIKDLFVHEETPPPAPKPAAGNSGASKEQHNQKGKGDGVKKQQQPRQQTAPPQAQKPAASQPQSQPQTQQKSQGDGAAAASTAASKPTGGAGTGAHLLRMRERRGYGTEGTAAPEAHATADFDFSAGLSVFHKSEELAKVATEDQGQLGAEGEKYRKDDFFDTLSCDITDREAGRKTRMTAAEERALNQDTFGAVALQSSNYGYRRSNYGRGGRGRGYGGGRGRGRGGRGRGGGRGAPAPTATQA